jgi:hypothetical protein
MVKKVKKCPNRFSLGKRPDQPNEHTSVVPAAAATTTTTTATVTFRTDSSFNFKN